MEGRMDPRKLQTCLRKKSIISLSAAKLLSFVQMWKYPQVVVLRLKMIQLRSLRKRGGENFFLPVWAEWARTVLPLRQVEAECHREAAWCLSQVTAAATTQADTHRCSWRSEAGRRNSHRVEWFIMFRHSEHAALTTEGGGGGGHFLRRGGRRRKCVEAALWVVLG